MLETIVKLFCFTLFAIINFYLMKKILNSKENVLNLKNIILLIGLIIISNLSYTTTYLIQPVLVRIITSIIVYKIIFDESLLKTSISFIIVMILVLIADLINTTILINFITIDLIRNCWYFILLSNINVIILLVIIVHINPLITKIQYFISKIKDEDYKFVLFFYCIIYITGISILYKISNINKLNIEYIINSAIIVVFILLIIYMSKTKHKYHQLLTEYDALFVYVQEFEDTIDSMSMDNHEYKNQLAMLKGYIEEQETEKALTVIEEMTKETYKKDTKILKELKYIPKGGLKGLLYYKIIVVNNNGLKLSINISKSVLELLKKLNLSQVKIICQLIGIYFDNAIEASKESKQKLIALEVYKLQDNIEFVFSNTFAKEKVKISKIGEKGYTTKGKGHGKGTYLANKVIAKNEFLDTKTDIINEMYVKKLIIKLNKKI